ncbi:hypothetical protein H9P43_002638 [Blastocladiella emersonii ATCC 22665]|nr:hypothetical protein H9P43_002638 [Blastocladiella emersonii ATCC 22665]
MASSTSRTAAVAGRAGDLLKRRGFLFPTAHIYSGLKGAYDLGPLAIELKRNIERHWWRSVVHAHPEIRGYDAPILTPAPVLRASGHVANFADLLVDDLLSGARFRADKAAPLETKVQADGTHLLVMRASDRAAAGKWAAHLRESVAPGARVETSGKDVRVYLRSMTPPAVLPTTPEGSYESPGVLELVRDAESSGTEPITVEYRGYANPATNSPFLTAPRPFNLLFKSFTDTTDPIDTIMQTTVQGTAAGDTLAATRTRVDTVLDPATVYLRPETAQGVFAAFPHVSRTLNLVPPFGLAQAGKAFRNEIRAEHLLFRSLEFEQLELQYFVHPTLAAEAHAMWQQRRAAWWRSLAARPDDFRVRAHADNELAHYAKGCVDIEYRFPWGWGELEGVANRGDYDLQCHAKATGVSFAVTDRAAGAPTPNTYVPYVIESSAGLTRAVLAFLYDAYDEVPATANSAESDTPGRPVLRLHPSLAPSAVAVLPVVGNRPELVSAARDVWDRVRGAGNAHFSLATATLETRGSIGKRYQAADEAGTPVCITVDDAGLQRGTVTVRHRDTRAQVEVPVAEVERVVLDMFAKW